MSVTLPSIVVFGVLCLGVGLIAHWLVADLMRWITDRWVKPRLAGRMGVSVEEMDRQIAEVQRACAESRKARRWRR